MQPFRGELIGGIVQLAPDAASPRNALEIRIYEFDRDAAIV
jgi:hypothetical protein